MLFAGNSYSPIGPGTFVPIAQLGLVAGSIAAAASANEKLHAAFAIYTATINFVGFSFVLSA